MTATPFDLRFRPRRKLPVLLQYEAGECGLVCMAMLSAYWGDAVDVPALRRASPISTKGSTLKELIAIAAHLKLRTRPVKIELAQLAQLRLPCVLHWNMLHFVVLAEVGKDHVVVHDPAIGCRRLRLDEASRHITGVALEVTPANEFVTRAPPPPIPLRQLVGRVEGLRAGLLEVFGLALALQACVLLVPFHLQWAVDEGLATGDADLLHVLGVGFLGLLLVQTCLGALRMWVTTTLASRLNYQWMLNVFGHMLRLPLRYFETRQMGDVISRFSSVQVIQQGITTNAVEALLDLVLVVCAFAVILFYGWQLALVSLLAVALYAGVRALTHRAQRFAEAEEVLCAAKQSSHLIESVRGLQTIRLFNRATERAIGWGNALAAEFNARLGVARMKTIQSTATTFILGGERIAIVWLAAIQVLHSSMTIGMLFALLSYKEHFTQRAMALVDKWSDFRRLRLHGERLADIVQTPVESVEPQGRFDADALPADLEVRGLSFRYSAAEPWVLQDVSFRIEAGECVAITGASGSGKTTLLKLLLGLLVPTEGEILFGGVPIAAMGLERFRSQIGTVMQDDMLFAGSVADNVTFFDPMADMERVEESARLAAVDKDVAALPMRYYTIVGDIGHGLSGGQKQRLILARALYKQPRLLVLDEATSHLDVQSETLVNDAVRNLGITRLLVAHRPDTIAMAERVLVLARGRLDDQPAPPTGVALRRA